MSREFIHVHPAPGVLRDFARWATAQTPKVRTVSTHAFAVPDDLFVQAPEELLIGARIDGHCYVSPAEDAANGKFPLGAPELLGVATPVGLTPAPGSPEADAAAMVAAPSPATVESATTAVLTALDVTAAQQGESEPAGDDAPEGVFPCPDCSREFTTERGRDTHRRQAHREE